MARGDKKNPDKLIQRHLILEYIRTNHEPQELEDMVPGTKFVEELFDTEGEPALFFDWEFMLFEAPLPELDFMAQRLFNKAQFAIKKEELVNGVIAAQVQSEVDLRKHQGLTMTADEIMELKIKASNNESNPIIGLVDKFGEALQTTGSPREAGREVHMSMTDTEGIQINAPTKVLSINIPETLTDGDIKYLISTIYPADGFPDEMQRVMAYFISIKDLVERRTALIEYIESIFEGEITYDSRNR